MGNIRVFIAILLLTGATQINGEQVQQLPEVVPQTLANSNEQSERGRFTIDFSSGRPQIVSIDSLFDDDFLGPTAFLKPIRPTIGLTRPPIRPTTTTTIIPVRPYRPEPRPEPKPKPEPKPEVQPETLPILDISKIKGRLLTPEEGCGFSKVQNTKIVGGKEAKIGSWPWIALIAFKAQGYRPGSAGYSFSCGGSLITSRHVLTAAHCINPRLWFVRLGEHDMRTESDGQHQDVDVKDIHKHEHYNKMDMKNDIAVLTLVRDVSFTDRIRPVCLPVNGKHNTFIGKNPFVAGWGATKEQSQMAKILQEVQVPVLENNVCKQAFRNKGALRSEDQFNKEIICAGHLEGGKDSCQGDSGGPLMLPIFEDGKFPFYQIGVVSYGIGCARRGLPGVYANIANYGDWIKDQIRK